MASVEASASLLPRSYQLKELQLKVIKPFVAGKDVFAVLSTGYGKSLCYAWLPTLYDHLLNSDLHKSITPMIAIMEDQFL